MAGFLVRSRFIARYEGWRGYGIVRSLHVYKIQTVALYEK